MLYPAELRAPEEKRDFYVGATEGATGNDKEHGPGLIPAYPAKASTASSCFAPLETTGERNRTADEMPRSTRVSFHAAVFVTQDSIRAELTAANRLQSRRGYLIGSPRTDAFCNAIGVQT